MMDEFDTWWASLSDQDKVGINSGLYGPRFLWDEATRRADRNARLECAEICRDIYRNYECSHIGADLCEQSIRATIPEDQP